MRINIYKDLDPSILIFLSQSRIYFYSIDFNQVGKTLVDTSFANELYFIDKVVSSIYSMINKKEISEYKTVNILIYFIRLMPK